MIGWIILCHQLSHSNTPVSSNMSSHGWFNTALMVEGKAYLPWLMDW